MLEILQYATSGFWVFVGHAILLSIGCHGAAALVVSLAELVRACRS